MKLIFVGSGSAFTVGADNYQSNQLLVNDLGERLLIDCGTDIRFSLNDMGLSYRDIDTVYVSHLHSDHIGGLEWLAFTRYFDPHCTKPVLWAPKRIIEDLWTKVLSGGLSSLKEQEATLSTYFNVHPIEDNGSFTWSGIEFKTLQMIHVSLKQDLMPCYGLFFKVNGMTVFLTTDTQFAPDYMMSYYNAADLIFHDCETAQETSLVHARYDDLKTLDKSIKKKMWLYHYNPGPLPDAIQDGFCGFVKKGQVFNLSTCIK